MRLRCSALILLIAAGALAADRRKPAIDPESPDGILLQHILQESAAPLKLVLLEQFVEQFPKAPAIAWAYEELLPIYLAGEQFDKAMTAGEKLLALDALDLDAADDALHAAEAKKDTGLIIKYAELTWDRAVKTAQTPQPGEPAGPDAVANWAKQTAFARDAMTYAEYMLYSAAKDSGDAETKSQAVQAIESRNPQSKYLQPAKDELTLAVEKGGTPDEKLAFAQRTLAKEPDNEDMLMVVAQYYMQHDRELPTVLNYSLRVIELLRQKAMPDDLTPEAWVEKRSNYTALAHWMAGVVYAQDGSWSLSDRHLREAMPHINGTAMLAAAYFYLGYDHYALASKLHDQSHVQDALKYNKLCAGMESPFREPAQRNLEVLKNEFNVE